MQRFLSRKSSRFSVPLVAGNSVTGENISSNNVATTTTFVDPTVTETMANRRTNWVAVDAKSLSRSELEAKIRDNPDNVDPSITFEFGMILVKHGLANKSDRLKNMRSGLLLLEASIQHGYQATDIDMITMAKAYYKMWLGYGVVADIYFLERSKEIFDQVMSYGDHQDPDALLSYCRVLQSLNQNEAAIGVINSLLSFTDGDPEYPSYLLYAGDIYKSLGFHDQAATQFFEATQLGPPRLFSKLEMMFIISRNIEESAKDKDEPCDDAYGMVYTHMVMEGKVPESVSYDDWISDSQTWMDMGHKCSIHGCHSLARDLYGQALLRDPNSYRKTKIWFMFSKSCNLCGLSSDAQLSIRQSLTVEPHNSQLLRALKSWSETSGTYKDESTKMNIKAVLDAVPREVTPKENAIKMIQGLFRGANSRHVMNAGKLKMMAKAQDNQKKGSALTKLNARIGTLFECEAKTILKGLHPVVLTVRADWAGRIRYVSVFDVNKGLEGKLPLPSTIFAPGMDYSNANPMQLSISCRQQLDTSRSSSNSSVDLFKAYYLHTDKESRAQQFSRPVSREVIDSSILLIPPKGACEGVLRSSAKDLMGHQILCIQFTDLITGKYIAKQFILAAIDSGGSFVQHEMPMVSPRSQDPALRQVETVLKSPRLAPSKPGSSKKSPKPAPKPAPSSMLELFSLAEVAGAPVVYTDIAECLVAYGSIRWNDSCYLYRINNRYLRTYISLYLVTYDIPICLSMPRIHIDRTANVKRFVQQLLANVEWCEPLMEMLNSHSIKGEHLTIKKAITTKNSDQLLLLKCSLHQPNSKYCASIEFFDPLGEAILDKQLAILDRNCFAQPPPLSPRSYVPIGEKERVVLTNESISAIEVEEEKEIPSVVAISDDKVLPASDLNSEQPETVIGPEKSEEDTSKDLVEADVSAVLRGPCDAHSEEVLIPESGPAETGSLLDENIGAGYFLPPPRIGSASAAVMVLAASTVALASQCAQVVVSSRPSTPQVITAPASPLPGQVATKTQISPLTTSTPSAANQRVEEMKPALTVESIPTPAPNLVADVAPCPTFATLLTPASPPAPAMSIEAASEKPFAEPSVRKEASFTAANRPIAAEDAIPASLDSLADQESAPEPLELAQAVSIPAITPREDVSDAQEELDELMDMASARRQDEEEAQPSPPRGMFKRQDTNGRLVEQVQAKKKISTIKTINFLEHERMRLEAFEYLYQLGMKTLNNYLREYSLSYLQNRAKEAIQQLANIAEEEDRLKQAALLEAELQRQREELKTPQGKKTPPSRLKKAPSERGFMKKSASSRFGAMSTRDLQVDSEASKSRKTRSAGYAVDVSEKGAASEKAFSVKITVDEGDADGQRSDAGKSDENSEAMPVQVEQSSLSIADSAGTSTIKGTVSTVSKGEPRYMNSILDAMKARDLRTSNTRVHDFTYKQQLLLRQPLDVDNLPEYAYESAQGLVLALQAQDREYEEYLQRKTAKEMMKLEQMQILQQREIAYSIQREKDLAQLRLEKKGSVADSYSGRFGPPKEPSPKKKRSKGNAKLMSSTVSGPVPGEIGSQDNNKLHATISGDRVNQMRSSSWTSIDDSFDVMSSVLYDEEDAVEVGALPPLPLNAEYSQTLFCESSAVGSIGRGNKRSLSKSQSLSMSGKQVPLSAGTNKSATPGQLPSPVRNRTALASFEKPVAMIAEGYDPMEFMNIRDRMSGVERVPGEELCQRLLDTHRVNGYIPVTAPEVDTGKFSHQWIQCMEALLTSMPSLRTMRKYINALQKSYQSPLSKLEAFCALASVGGKVPDALGKLMDKEFKMEVSLACKILPIDSIVAEYEGLFELLFVDDRKLTALRGSRREKGRRTGGKVGSSEEYSPSRSHSRSPQNKSLSPGRTHSPITMEGDSIGVFSKPTTADDQRIRIKGLDASKLLPHLNMLQTSHAVRSRGTEISIINNAFGARQGLSADHHPQPQGSVSKSQSLDLNASSIASSGFTNVDGPPVNSLFPAISAISSTRTLPAVQGSASSKLFLSPEELHIWQSEGSPSYNNGNESEDTGLEVSFAIPNKDVNTSSTLSPTRHEVVFNLASELADKSTSLKLATQRSKSSKVTSRLLSSKGGTAINPSGAINVEKLVDHIGGSSQLLVMSRKDAYRAMEDETLSRSMNDRFRGMSTQGKIENRDSRGDTKLGVSSIRTAL